jgi:hypothetical protein
MIIEGQCEDLKISQG